MTESNHDKIKQSAKQVLTELGLPEVTVTRCLTILDDPRTKTVLTTRNTNGVIAGVIYIAAILTENRVSQLSVADVMDISEATIHKYYVMLVKALDLKEKKV
jgi:transcription initiation factor TFIIIB Brf1 subunit/transcription initiation factor TFIIB